MTLNDIIVNALMQMDRGHDAQTLDIWRDKLTGFANDAIADLAMTIKPVRTEKAEIDNSCIDCSRLQRECVKVVRVRINGRDMPFYGTMPTAA